MAVSRRKPFEPLPRATIDAARNLFADGATATAIAKRLKMSAATVSRYAASEGWSRARKGAAKSRPAKAPAKHAAVKRQGARPPARNTAPEQEDAGASAASFGSDRQSALIDRLWRVAERHVAEIEKRIGADEPAAGERDARALAVLTRMLRELAALSTDARPGNAAAEDDDDDLDRDIDECRAAVARLLRGLPAPGPAGAGDPAGDVAAPAAQDGDGLAVSRAG